MATRTTWSSVTETESRQRHRAGGRVISQDPPPGDEVPQGTEVQVVVSAPPRDGHRDRCHVPLVRLGEVRAPGARVVAVLGGTAPVLPQCPNPNRVASRIRPPATTVDVGSTVTLYTGRRRRPDRPGHRGRRDDDPVRGRDVHARGARDPRAPLHQPRRSGVRADEPAGGREGRAVRAVLADEEVAPTTVPGRVRGGRGSDRRADARGRGARASSSTSACSWSTATTRWRSSAACTWRASRRRSCCARRSSGDGWPPTWSSPRGTCATTTGRAMRGARPFRRRSPARALEPRFAGVPRHGVRGVRPHVRADGGVLSGPVPARTPRDSDFVYRSTIMAKTCDTLRMLLPGRDPLEPGDLRDRPVLRAAPDAPRRASARRDARVRRPDARRAPQGDPGVPEACRRRRARASRGPRTGARRVAACRTSRPRSWPGSSPSLGRRSRSRTRTPTAR